MSSKKRVIITGIFLIILLTLSLVYLLLPKIEIELKGEKFINLNVGEVYNESGADAYIKTLGKKKKIDIDIIGEVDNKVIGKYIITYRASKGN